MVEYNEPVVSNAGDKIAIEGHSKGTGVFGKSATWHGVVGASDSGGFGVKGEANGAGVVGESTGWHGVYGTTKGPGASGAAAVVGENKSNGTGVVGIASSGLAGYFKSGGTGQGGVSVVVDGGRFECGNTIVGNRYNAGILAGRFNGDIVVTGAVKPSGNDYAEKFDTEEGAEPGTVLVIGENGLLAPCDEEYDTAATGVVSGAGGLKSGSVLQGETDGSHDHDVTVALAGQVYVKADAAYGAISVGDLLTTSLTEGFARRVADRPRAVGAIIGKALSPLPSGTGLVRMLVVNS